MSVIYVAQQSAVMSSRENIINDIICLSVRWEESTRWGGEVVEMRSFSSGAAFLHSLNFFFFIITSSSSAFFIFFFTVSLYRAFLIYLFLCFATSMFLSHCLLSISGWNLLHLNG